MNPEENSVPIRQKPTYSQADTLYAWLSMLFAFLLCQSLPVTAYPLGGFLVILALYGAGFVILRMKKQKITPVCILSALSTLLISSAMLLTDSGFLVSLSLAYSLAGFSYFLYAAFGNRIEDGFSDYIYIDFLKILFILPFRYFGTLFIALANKSAQKSSRFMLKILIGLGITAIPTLLVLIFLSYDDGFMKILNGIFSFRPIEIARFLRSLFFTLPMAMYGFGLYMSCQRNFLKDKITAQTCQNGLRKAQILPRLTAVVTVVPILFLYVVFFISQWQYYISGFTGVLPENFSYAEYARQGFFQLCAVSVLNLLLIVVIAFFIRRSQKGSSVILTIITVVFCLCTLILISTAVAKLVMYIDYYGLTQKRIYAMWLMALIAIVFLLIAVGQFAKKLKVVAVSLTVAIAMFTGLAVCNVNSLCAQYNTERYLSGTLETLDVEAMDELGDSAIPSLVRIATSMDAEKDPELKYQIDVILHEKIASLREEDISVFSFSLPSAMAKDALKNYVPNIPPAGSYIVTSFVANDCILSQDSAFIQIHPDRTGILSYKDTEYPFVIVADEMRFEDVTLTIEYIWYWRDPYRLSSVILNYNGETDSCSIVMEYIEE